MMNKHLYMFYNLVSEKVSKCIVYLFSLVYMQLRYIDLDTYFTNLGYLFKAVSYNERLEVNKREEGIVAIHLPIQPLKT